MKLIIASHALKKALAFVGSAIAANPIVPVMENVRFDVSDGQATLTGSDLQTTLIATVTVDSLDEGSALVPYKRLNDLLNTAPDGPVTLKLDTEGFIHKVILSSGKYTITGEDPKDYNLKDGEIAIESTLVFTPETRPDLFSCLASVAYACGTNEMMPANTGVYWHFADTLRLVASDGKTRLVVADTEIPMQSARSFIIPGSFCKKIINLAKDLSSTDSVTVSYSDRKVIVSAGGKVLKAMLIDTHYLPYQQAIPVDHDKILSVNRMELAASIKRVSLFSNQAVQMIRFSLVENTIEIAADDSSYGVDAHETLSVSYSGEPIDLGFNAKMMLELLLNLTSETVTLQMSTPSRGTLILDKNTTGVIFSHQVTQPVAA